MRVDVSLCFKVSVRGEESLVIAVEKRSVAQLQDPRTVRKICSLDDHICMTFAGQLLHACVRLVLGGSLVGSDICSREFRPH